MKLILKSIIIVIIVLITFIGVVFADQPDMSHIEMPALPMSFTLNAGQINADINYYVRGLSGVIYFSPSEISLALPLDNDENDTHMLTLHHVNANPEPTIVGWEELRGKVNYFSGKDSTDWFTNIPTYAGIQYQSLYPGIDVIYDGVEGILKGTYYLDPDTNPDVIRWQYDGIESVSVATDTGNVIMHFADDEQLIEHAPIAWQVIEGQQVSVEVAYQVDDDTIGFTLGNYDPNYTLVIDPVLEYSTYIGGSGADTAWGIAVDSDGYAYVVGETSSADLPGITSESFDSHGTGAFITKIDTNTFGANSIVWSTYLNAHDAFDVAVDNDGDVYVVGGTNYSDFAVTDSAFQPNKGTTCCTSDAFLTKLSSDGTQLLYSTYIGGRYQEDGYSVAVDSHEYAYVGGLTGSPNFPVTESGYDTTQPHNPNGGAKTFIAKIDTNGNGENSLLYSTFIGGRTVLYGGIAADDAGNVFVSGRVQPSDFQYPLKNPYQYILNDVDVFIARFDTTKSGVDSLVYSTYFGGSSTENVNYLTGDIATDGNGIAYVTGETMSTDLPVVNGFDSTYGGGIADGFVAVFDTNASGVNSLLYSTYLGGSGFDQGYGIAATRNGNVYVTGQSRSGNFPQRDAIQSYGGSTGSFVTKIDTTLVGNNSLIYSTFLGRNGNGYGGSAVDGHGTAYVAGQIAEDDFPIVGGFQPENGGGTDAYMAKLSFRSDIQITKTVTPETTFVGEPITIKIDVRGRGPEVATGVIVTEVIPESIFTVISAIPTQGSCELFPSVVYCKIGNLKKGQLESIEIIIMPISTTNSGGAAALSQKTISALNALPSQRDSFIRATALAEDDSVAVVATVDGVEEDTNPDDNTVERDISVYTFETYVPVLLVPSNGEVLNNAHPKIKWEAIMGADHYELQISNFDATVVDAVEVDGTSYTPEHALLFIDYEWRVRGIRNDDTPTEWSSLYTFSIETSLTGSPTLDILETHTPTLSWNRVTDATEYEVEVDIDSKFTQPLSYSETVAGDTLYVTTSSLPNGVYYWRVRGKDGTNIGSWSIVQTFTVNAP